MSRNMIHMKKPFIRLILFMVLMLVLTAGLTYMSLNHVSETKDKEDSKKMDVALVNEDEGTTFNKEELDFGERFVKSLDKNNEQDRSEEHTSELQSRFDLVCRLLLEKK